MALVISSHPKASTVCILHKPLGTEMLSHFSALLSVSKGLTAFWHVSWGQPRDGTHSLMQCQFHSVLRLSPQTLQGHWLERVGETGKVVTREERNHTCSQDTPPVLPGRGHDSFRHSTLLLVVGISKGQKLFTSTDCSPNLCALWGHISIKLTFIASSFMLFVDISNT